MEPMSLREAAERTARSITTLRRYIRSGRLRAEKRHGRFGPEYFVASEELARAGFEPDGAGAERGATLALRGARNLSPFAGARASTPPDAVPLALYQELQMKHEQLLVQYGMVRAGGLRVLELRAELDDHHKRAADAESALERARREHDRRTAELTRNLREAQLELEGRRLEIDALQEKVRALEMLTRNAVTNETIDAQFRRLLEQAERVEALQEESASWRSSGPSESPDH
jgi:hypothetical protein